MGITNNKRFSQLDINKKDFIEKIGLKMDFEEHEKYFFQKRKLFSVWEKGCSSHYQGLIFCSDFNM